MSLTRSSSDSALDLSQASLVAPGGVIPEGSYGAGAMIVWDRGRVSYPRDSAEEGLEKGALSFELDGFKLKGRFSLVRPKKQDDKQSQWLLIKRDDVFASEAEVTDHKPRSVLSGMAVQELGNAEQLYDEARREAAAAGAKKGEVHASRLTRKAKKTMR